MRAKLYLNGISLFYAVLWCRQNSIPIVVAKSFRSGPTKWIGKVFYYGSLRIIEEGVNTEIVAPNNCFYVLVRPADFDLVLMRFGRLEEGWKNA